jgi:hypothetical protein
MEDEATREAKAPATIAGLFIWAGYLCPFGRVPCQVSDKFEILSPKDSRQGASVAGCYQALPVAIVLATQGKDE